MGSATRVRGRDRRNSYGSGRRMARAEHASGVHCGTIPGIGAQDDKAIPEAVPSRTGHAMSLDAVISLLAIGLGATSVATALVGYLKELQSRSTSSNALEKADVSTVLTNPDIDKLGSVLRNDIGKVRVSDYTRDQAVRRRFNDLVGEILDFVGDDREAELSPAQGRDNRERFGTLDGEVFPELTDAYREVAGGEVWNGLARARRAVEIEFRQLLGIPLEVAGSSKPISLGAMTGQLLAGGALNEGDAIDLRYAIDLCNRAVHGYPVGIANAAEALSILNRILLNLHGRNEPSV
ncbi:hypothetical protein SAMN04515669_6227 [Jiangella sp. DSM 45060]|nr:hypothetical protein SAMN04515669_6227 [Jiangella sp. DSM 45060]